MKKNEGLHLLDDPIRQNSLQRINSISGEIVWQQELDGIVREITNNAQYIYVAFSTLKRAQFDAAGNMVSSGAIKVAAYDIVTGTAVWSDIYEGITFAYYMDSNEEIVAIHGDNGPPAFNEDIYIDARTGNLTEEKLAGFGSKEELPVELSEEGIRSLHWEKLSDGNFVVSTDTGIYAYNSDSESTLWEINTGLVVTDFSVDKGVIFFLTDDATLWAIDEISGQQLGKVQFTDTAFANEGPIANWGIAEYIVNADSGTITIFSRDTQYLFTFRFFN